MGISVHVAERTDALADGLARVLGSPLPDPFAEELVVVPAKGVERWLTQRLSHHLGTGAGDDGVCAGVRFVNPRSLVALLTGTDRTDPWDPDRLVWPVLAAIDDSVGEPWCATLARHLGAGFDGEDLDLRRDRRWSVARRLAGLFASYAVQRPSLVADWSAGDLSTPAGDGAGGRLDEDLAWQPELWRRVVALVTATGAPTPAQRHQGTLDQIRSGAELALPQRLSLFGHTRLPVTEVELVAAVGQTREVHLWLPTASPGQWRRRWDAEAQAGRTGQAGRALPRRDDHSAAKIGHPLLSSLGRDSRELERALGALAAEKDVQVELTAPVDHPATLLGWLQSDVRADRVPDAATRAGRPVRLDDRSVQLHAAHGLARQVEVLREVLVGLLEDDPTLEPRDILVMCPDIDTVAPLVQAGFGLGGVVPHGHPAHRLRVRLADRGLAATNPFLAVAAQLLHLCGSRQTVTEVLDLAAAGPVRHRFGFRDDDLATLATWAADAEIRWGLDERGRAAYRLGRFAENTWTTGLDRLLVGVTMAEGDALVGDVLPLDDVGSGTVDLVGRFAELVERLRSSVESLVSATALDDWVRLLREGVLAVASAPARDAWQVAQFERELAGVLDAGAATEAADDGPPQLRLADLRALLTLHTAGRPTRANFRTGSLTVCTMVPMRSVPHRVVALLGLDDGVFPRSPGVDGDDALARNPLTGERDVRSEDRQLLLDAVLAASEHLVITYTGANEHTGQPRPPAVPVGELLDALDLTAAAPLRDQVVTHHPLQPYDPRNLTPGQLGTHEPFSFDPAASRGALAAAGPRHRREPLVPQPLPARPVEDLALEDLQAFLEHPVRSFLRNRLDVATPLEADEPDDALPVELDALQKWHIGDRMLRRVVDGTAPQVVIEAELHRGALPPDGLGHHVLGEVAAKAKALLARTESLRAEPARTVDVRVELLPGRVLTGAVGGVRGATITSLTYSSLGPKQRLHAWVDLLALSATDPSVAWEAVTVGWGSAAKGPWQSRLGPLAPGADPAERAHLARTWLLDLVETYDQGMREPLPIPLRTAHTWVTAERRRDGSGDDQATREWEGGADRPVPGEREDRSHVLVHGAGSSFRELRGEPRSDERWNDAPHRLARYATRIWTPLLEHERQRSA